MGSRFKQWLLDPILIIGAVTSVIAPVVLYQRGSGADFSLLVGLIIFVVTLQLQLILTDKDRLNRETLYGKIAAALESTPNSAADARTILDSMERAEQRFHRSPVQDTYRFVLRRISGELAELSEGWMSLPPSEKRLILGITQRARHFLHAVTVEGPNPAFWNSGTGRLYVEAQRDAIGRGVEIKRVVVFSDWSPQLDQLAQEQRKMGVQIYRVNVQLLTDPHDRVNIAVWDNFCGFETTSTPDGDTIANRFTIREAEIDRLAETFERVWAVREEIP